MREDDVREVLDACARDAAADAGRGEQPPPVEPAVPLVHSFDDTVDPLAERLSDRFRRWRSTRRDRPAR